MATAWNYERRQLTCAKFVIGVWLIAKGKAGVETSLEAVRNRVRLPPEDALFAARRLDEEQLVAFDPGGDVRAVAKGIARAEELLEKARSKTREIDDVTSTLSGGGVPLAILELAVIANGGSLPCGATTDGATSHRLVLIGNALVLEPAERDA